MIAIRVDNLGKRYHIGGRQQSYRTLRDSVTDALAAPWRKAGRLLRGQATAAANLHESIWALKDVSFEIKKGEVVGIIGRNGAGKSTLLKILSRITEPTEGRAEIHGRVGSLLEVGTGFHPELTGRENIYLNGAILGMKREEIDRKFDEIVAFADIEKFIDTPVKHYSSGMYLRLAFAVAAHLDPEILVIDEVLAVGDAEFQKKCLGKMEKISSYDGKTILFVSHNLGAINNLCQKVMILNKGSLFKQGTGEEVIPEYLRTQYRTSNNTEVDLKIDYSSEDETWRIGSAISIRVIYPEKFIGFYVDLAFYDDFGEKLFLINGSKGLISNTAMRLGDFNEIKIINPGFSNLSLTIDLGIKEKPNYSYSALFRSAAMIPTPDTSLFGVINGKIIPKIEIK